MQTKHLRGEKCPLAKGSREHSGLDDSEFSSFLFWRNPLPSIEEDLQELLVRAPLCSFTLLTLPMHCHGYSLRMG